MTNQEGGAVGGSDDDVPRGPDEPAPAATPATYEITIRGVRRDALYVHEVKIHRLASYELHAAVLAAHRPCRV